MVNKNSVISFAENCSNYLLGITTNFECNNIFINIDDFEFFKTKLNDVSDMLKQDLDFFMLSDPAVDSKDEVIIAYPGYKAIAYHRIAHVLYNMDYKLEARIISEQAHFLTGIDIHPGATIGSPFFIDHGTGIVIGETAIVGDRVKIYQGVTLGALSLSKGIKLKGTKRHPTIKNDVTIYSGASILGDVIIGNRVTIGSNVFVLDSIEDDYKVTMPKPDLVLIKK